VVVGSREPDIFTGEHIEMLTAVCSQATIALQNGFLMKPVFPGYRGVNWQVKIGFRQDS
jgi:hypothetical protein